jgi:hypothetical protein
MDNYFQKEFPQRKLCVQLSVRIPKCKPEKQLLKIICLETDGVKHSFTIILCCPVALVKVKPHPVPHWVRQVPENGTQAICGFFRYLVLPNITYFSFSVISFSKLKVSYKKNH